MSLTFPSLYRTTFDLSYHHYYLRQDSSLFARMSNLYHRVWFVMFGSFRCAPEVKGQQKGQILAETHAIVRLEKAQDKLLMLIKRTPPHLLSIDTSKKLMDHRLANEAVMDFYVALQQRAVQLYEANAEPVSEVMKAGLNHLIQALSPQASQMAYGEQWLTFLKQNRAKYFYNSLCKIFTPEFFLKRMVKDVTVLESPPLEANFLTQFITTYLEMQGLENTSANFEDFLSGFRADIYQTKGQEFAHFRDHFFRNEVDWPGLPAEKIKINHDRLAELEENLRKRTEELGRLAGMEGNVQEGTEEEVSFKNNFLSHKHHIDKWLKNFADPHLENCWKVEVRAV